MLEYLKKKPVNGCRSVIGIAGFTATAVMGIYLLIAIIKKERL